MIVQPQVRFPVFQSMRIANLCMLIAGGLHILAVLQEGKPLIRWGPATKIGAALFLAMYLSMLMGPLNSAIYWWHPVVEGSGKFILTMVLIEAMAYNTKRVWAVMATLGISSLWWMKAGYRLAAVGASFRGDRLMGPATGLTTDPNAFAYLVCLLIPLYLYLGKYTTNKWVGWGYRAMSLLCVYIIFETGSRSGFVALIIMGLFLAIHFWRTQKMLIFLIPIGIVCIMPFVNPSNRERVLSIKQSVNSFVYGKTEVQGTMSQDEHSAYERRMKSKQSWELVKRYPVFGTGVVADQSRFPEDLPYTRGLVHCEILRAGVEMGWIGMLLYAGMVGIVIIGGWRIYRVSRGWIEKGEIAWTLFAQGVTIAVAGYFSPIPWGPVTMILCGATGALVMNVKDCER